MQAVVTPRLLQSHSLGRDCTVNGAWSFKHGILAMLPSNSTLENDSREQTRLDCWSASHLSSAVNIAWDAAAGRRGAAFKCFLPCILLNFPFTRRHTRLCENKTCWQGFDRIITHSTLSPPRPHNTPTPPNRDRLSVPWACGLLVTNKRSATLTCVGGQKMDEEPEPEEMTQTRARLTCRLVSRWAPTLAQV